MRVIILGVADDRRQADPVLRALERSGYTVDDVTVLLACPDEYTSELRPVVGLNLPAGIQPHDDISAGPVAGFIAVTTQPTILGVGIFAAARRPPTETVNVRIERPAPSGVARDLHGLGIALPEAHQIGTAVHAHNLLLLVEERPGCSFDAIIDAMLAEGLTKVFMVTVAEEQDAARQPDSSGERTDAERPLPEQCEVHPYF
jgi:hypothetical protein